MVRSLVVTAFLVSFLFAGQLEAAKCVGAANCKVCTDCSRCEHCKGSGSCGVCSKRPSIPLRPDPPPAVPPKTNPSTIPKSIPRPAPATPQPVSTPPLAKAVAKQDGITLYFSPRGGCTAAIVEQITSAKTSVKVQAYRLTSIPIVKALAAAHDRGVKVAIILDKAQQSDKYSDATYFANRGMNVIIDPKHAIAHNKIILIDDQIVITGSFNFSANAEEDNAENLLIIEDKKDLMAAYLKNFDDHASHAVPYRGVAKESGEVDSNKNDAFASYDYRIMFARHESKSCCDR